MRRKVERKAVNEELIVAIGLIWGSLKTFQFEEAYQLARGCLRVWPDDKRLAVMAAFAAVELLEPLDDRMRTALDSADCGEWAELVMRRAAMHA